MDAVFIKLFFYAARFQISVSNYLLKVNNRNTRTRYEICSKLTIKTPERRLKVDSKKTSERRQ